MSMDILIEASNRYGSNTDYVIAGGGNTSWKTDEYMYVKGSGTELGTIKSDGFVKIDLKKLDTIWTKNYSVDEEKREEEVLIDLMDARFPGEGEKRPSVETLLHGLLPYTFVVHTHPSLVNGITCSRNAPDLITDLFGDKALWVPITNPGYILAKAVKDKINKHLKAGKEFPTMIFLQNHGVFVSGNSMEEIDGKYERIFEAINGKIGRKPDLSRKKIDALTVQKAEQIIEKALGKNLSVLGFFNEDILRYAESSESFEPLSLSFTPDHIVYYGFKPVYSEDLTTLGKDLQEYVKKYDVIPRLAVLKNVGAFAINTSEKLVEKSVLLFEDDVKIAVYTESFEGYQFMPQDKIDFIRNWEVEKYRVSQA